MRSSRIGCKRARRVPRLVAWGTIPLGSLAAGFLLQTFGTIASFLVLAGVSLGVAVAATATRVVRNAPQVEALLAEGQAAATLRLG
jgi:hypothetical protein